MTTEKPDRPETVQLYTEDSDGTTVILTAQRRLRYTMRFKTMFEPTFQSMATMDRPSTYWRVLFHALAVLDPVQFRPLPNSDISEATGMSQLSAQRALTMLIADRVLIPKGNTSGRRVRINNRIAWGSTAHKHNLAEADLEVIDARGRK